MQSRKTCNMCVLSAVDLAPLARHFTALAHTFKRTHTPSHASDVRMEFGVESQVDEGSGDLHPPASP